MEILLFTTNIQRPALPRLRSLLESLPGIKKWTVDLDDCDHVLRIVCINIPQDVLQNKLNEAGFDCRYML